MKKNKFNLPKKEEKTLQRKIAELVVCIMIFLFLIGSVLGTIAFFRTNKKNSISASAASPLETPTDVSYLYRIDLEIPANYCLGQTREIGVASNVSFGSLYYNAYTDEMEFVQNFTSSELVAFPSNGTFIPDMIRAYSYTGSAEPLYSGIRFLTAQREYDYQNVPAVLDSVRIVLLSVTENITKGVGIYSLEVSRRLVGSTTLYTSSFQFRFDNSFYGNQNAFSAFWSNIPRVTYLNYSSNLNQNYTSGYDYGFSQGFLDGNSQGQDIGYENGYNSGYDVGLTTGTEQGYQTGYDNGYIVGKNVGLSEKSYSFTELLSAVIDTPLNAVIDMFNFDLLGINLSGFFLSLLTVCIIITIVRLLI